LTDFKPPEAGRIFFHYWRKGKVDTNRIIEWVNAMQGWLDPPGCETEFVSLPTPRNGSCTVGIVHEHRFAFFYWALYSHDRSEPHPILITLDSHNDIGVPREVIPDDLDNLDIGNRTELGLFAWLRLRSLNDGHILPALYLDFFSDVYVLLNKDVSSLEFQLSNSGPKKYNDRMGKMHAVKFYRHANQLLRDLPAETPVYLDIDLDFFAIDNPQAGSVLGSERLLPDNEISSILSLEEPFMGLILNRIVGLTIALEPKYCGGLHNSLHVLDILNYEFFDGTLCTHSCKWKKRANQ
jgi:hypothetical protein